MRRWLRFGVALLLSLLVVITGAAWVSHARGGIGADTDGATTPEARSLAPAASTTSGTGIRIDTDSVDARRFVLRRSD